MDRILRTAALALFVTFVVNGVAFAQNNNASKSTDNPGKVFAEASLVTNSVERGVSQSDGSLALQTGFGYQWSQFRLGLWGSNVKYPTAVTPTTIPNSDDSLNLRLYGAYKFIISQNADLTVKYALNKYFKTGTRDGAITSVDLQMFTYHVTYESLENWEGSGVASIRYGFGKEFKFYWDTIIDVNAGYSDNVDTGFSNAGDLRASWKYKYADILWGLTFTAHSAGKEYDSRGAPSVYASIGVNF